MTFPICFQQRTSPTEKDRQIQSSLGDFQCLKQLIERDILTHGSRLVGVSSSQLRQQQSFPTQAAISQKLQLSPQQQPPQMRSSTKQVTFGRNQVEIVEESVWKPFDYLEFTDKNQLI